LYKNVRTYNVERLILIHSLAIDNIFCRTYKL